MNPTPTPTPPASVETPVTDRIDEALTQFGNASFDCGDFEFTPGGSNTPEYDAIAAKAAVLRRGIMADIAQLERELSAARRDADMRRDALVRLLRAFEADAEIAPGLDIKTCWETNSQAIKQAREAIE